MVNAIGPTGSAVISVNPQETEARLLFTPDPEGDAWDAAAVNKLASEKQIAVSPDPKELEAFLAKAAKAKTSEPLEMVYARGVEPEAPAPETIKWELLSVPEDIAPFQEEITAEAGPPEIIRVKKEKIKREKTVKKSGGLPFLEAKEDIEVTWEIKERRERVKVRPDVGEIKYAARDTKIGTFIPAVPGKTGKTVSGRPIPPPPADGGPFFFGKGIVRDKNDLYAQVSGFIRIGDNWADAVPFAKHSWNVSLGFDGLTFFFNFTPGDPRFALPEGEEILAAAAAQGAAESVFISPDELDTAIAEAVETQTPLEAHSLFRVQEAEARVDISPDKTRAALYLRKGVAGALPLDMKAVSLALKDSGVHGFDADKLRAVIREFIQGKDIELKDYLLLEGTPSTRGKDREVKVEADLLSGEQREQVSSRVSEWKKRNARQEAEADPDSETGFAFVEKGALVASVTPVSEGEAGKDIFGNVIPGLPGNDPDIRLVRGLELRGTDITASRDGLLVMEASEKSFSGEVIDYRDAEIDVHVSEDAMEAGGDFFREEGAGLPLTVDTVRKTLTELGIKKGIDWKAVEKACAHARAHGSVLGRVFARGEKPVAQGGSAVKWLLPAAETNSVQIKAGTPIAEISAPIATGRPGYDIKGTEIPVDNATVLRIEHDDSVREEGAEGASTESAASEPAAAQAGTRLIAARSGELRFDGGKLSVSFRKTITGDAGPDTGDITFSGEIQINGNVLPGSRVVGSSHVIIDGLAEEAFISAGGKAVTAKGFKGGGKGILRARAGIESAFVERAVVSTLGDIRLNRGSILSSVKTNGKILVVAENGKLSGGIYQARAGIDAADVGSEKGVRTELSFGQDYVIKDAIHACEGETAKLTRLLSLLEEKLTAYLAKKLPFPDDLKKEKIRLVKFQEQFKLRLFTLREKFEEHFESEIRIRGTVFPGVVIESHNRYYEVKQKRSRVSFFFDRESGRIKEKPIE